MIRATDIHSLTDFTRNAKRFVSQVRETKQPVALTVNGEAEVVIQDAESYQRDQDELERLRLVAAIAEGEAAIAAGRVYPAEEALKRIKERGKDLRR